MSERWPGGLISRSAPVVVGPTGGEGGSAPGIWTINQIAPYVKAGTWPLPLKDRKLFTTGDNNYYQLGQNNQINLSSPVQVGSLTDWTYISNSQSQIGMAVKTDGTLWGWGRNDWGQIGSGNTTYFSSPVQIGSLTTWSKVTTNRWACFFIRTSGELWVSGRNVDGCMGLNQDGFLSIYAISSPVQVGSATWSSIVTGNGGVDPFVLGIRTNGTLWAWGNNAKGQLGDGTVQFRSSPVQIGALTTWLTAACGTYHSVAVKTDGTLWSWGGNSSGQLGITSRIYRSSPVQIGALTTWSTPTASSSSCVVKTSQNALYSWGSNSVGVLGLNISYTSYRSSPVQIGTDTDWNIISGSSSSSILAIKTNGTLWAWGNNGSGEYGNGNTIHRSSPVQVGSDTTWLNVSSGADWSMMVKY